MVWRLGLDGIHKCLPKRRFSLILHPCCLLRGGSDASLILPSNASLYFFPVVPPSHPHQFHPTLAFFRISGQPTIYFTRGWKTPRVLDQNKKSLHMFIKVHFEFYGFGISGKYGNMKRWERMGGSIIKGSLLGILSPDYKVARTQRN